jgi:hypothetical protein
MKRITYNIEADERMNKLLELIDCRLTIEGLINVLVENHKQISNDDLSPLAKELIERLDMIYISTPVMRQTIIPGGCMSYD